MPLLRGEEAAEEEMEWPDEDHGHKQKGSHWVPCALILFNVLVGGGLITLPSSVVAAGGLVPAFSLLGVYAFLLWTTHVALAWSSDVKKSTTYQETVASLLGGAGEGALILFLILICIFVPSFLMVAVGDMLQKVYLDIFGRVAYCEMWYLGRSFQLVLVTACLVLPLSLVKHIDKLKYMSMVATVGIFAILGICFYTYLHTDQRADHMPTTPDTVLQVFMAIPGFSIAYTNHLATVSVYARLSPRTLEGIAKSSGLAILLGTFFYTSVPTLVLAMYGSSVAEDFTASLTAGGVILRLTLIIYAFKLTFEAPVIVFVGRECVYTILGKCGWGEGKDAGFTQRALLTLCWLSVVLGIALYFPSISYLTTPLGMLNIWIIMIFPAMCFFQALRQSPWVRGRRLLQSYSVFLVLLGLFLVILMAIQALALFNATKTDFASAVCLNVTVPS